MNFGKVYPLLFVAVINHYSFFKFNIFIMYNLYTVYTYVCIDFLKGIFTVYKMTNYAYINSQRT